MIKSIKEWHKWGKKWQDKHKRFVCKILKWYSNFSFVIYHTFWFSKRGIICTITSNNFAETLRLWPFEIWQHIHLITRFICSHAQHVIFYFFQINTSYGHKTERIDCYFIHWDGVIKSMIHYNQSRLFFIYSFENEAIFYSYT